MEDRRTFSNIKYWIHYPIPGQVMLYFTGMISRANFIWVFKVRFLFNISYRRLNEVLCMKRCETFFNGNPEGFGFTNFRS